MAANRCSAKLLRLKRPPRFLPGAVVAKLGRLKDGEAGRPDVGSGFEAKQFRYYGSRLAEVSGAVI